MKMLLLLIITVALSSQSMAQCNRVDSSFFYTRLLPAIKSSNECNDKWEFKNGTIFRRHKGYHYQLVDTGELYVFTRAVTRHPIPSAKYGFFFRRKETDGYFSDGPCGKLYRLDYFVLRRHFKHHSAFIKAIKKTEDAALYKTAPDGSCSLLNYLYKQHVPAQ